MNIKINNNLQIDGMHVVFGVLMIIWAFLFVWFGGVSSVDVVLALLLSVTYFLWGVVYHLKHQSLGFKNVVEYFLMALIGFVILAFTIS